ncbi:hypothetical protein N7541_009493 [Penicillium brevicompactum]|uniref:Uncharacterized protein n=1 Tax=Penicillium brevicompactum TaxID=5074 RepID=A0A9W9UHB7_PENBR|nr:hypothetical protein N7541_009493 [Penicillium brevicompactum]
MRLKQWTECLAQQEDLYSFICGYLQSAERSRHTYCHLEQGLESYGRIAVEEDITYKYGAMQIPSP